MTRWIGGISRLLGDSRYARKVARASDPAVTDDAGDGYRPGDVWINTATLNEFCCISNAAGAAVWRFRPRTIHQSGVAVALTGTTNETALRTVPLVANVIGLTGCLDCRALFTTLQNDASGKTTRIRFGASGAGVAGTEFAGLSIASTLSSRLDQFIQNITTSTQKGRGAGAGVAGYNIVAAAAVTGAIDTTAATEVVFSGLLADNTDTMSLEWSQVTLTRPDIGP